MVSGLHVACPQWRHVLLHHVHALLQHACWGRPHAVGAIQWPTHQPEVGRGRPQLPQRQESDDRCIRNRSCVAAMPDQQGDEEPKLYMALQLALKELHDQRGEQQADEEQRQPAAPGADQVDYCVSPEGANGSSSSMAFPCTGGGGAHARLTAQQRRTSHLACNHPSLCCCSHRPRLAQCPALPLCRRALQERLSSPGICNVRERHAAVGSVHPPPAATTRNGGLLLPPASTLSWAAAPAQTILWKLEFPWCSGGCNKTTANTRRLAEPTILYFLIVHKKGTDK